MSWIEVESKIRVKNVPEARRRIKSIASFVENERKKDTYFTFGSVKGYPKKGLRVRDKGDKVEVNFKQWISYKKGVHAKKEVEFQVSDLSGFFELLKEFGFKEWVKKDKFTELYRTKDKVNVELNNVKGLGWFIEIEILCQKNEVEKSRKRVDELIEVLGFGKKDIEGKGYTRLLWEKKHKS